MATEKNSAYNDDDLAVTTYIDHNHPSIVELSTQLVNKAKSKNPTDVAVTMHNYVRDEILFGWSGKFWNQKASEVLKTGRGFCNTKSSLFAALLRAAKIPCRLQFVDINTEILYGITDPRIPYEIHTYTEVFNSETKTWSHLDSYIVDMKLANAAKEKLKLENKTIGYGIHIDGISQWNGYDDCFIQFVQNSELNAKLAKPLSNQAFGSYADIQEFYAAADKHGSRDRLENPILRLLFPLLIFSGNRNAQHLRAN